MKRLGLFVFYHPRGIVSEDTVYLLTQLKSILSSLIIIVNGYVAPEGKEMFGRYGERTIVRDNAGFDGGAYADVLCLLGKEALAEWDEVVFCNNTFFGPFVPFADIFETMATKRADFWGLRLVERNMYAYLESYFLAFRQPVLQSGDLFRFFSVNRELLTVADYHSVCAIYERGLYAWLKHCGYREGAYAGCSDVYVFLAADYCVIYEGLPILKKKCLDVRRYGYDQLKRLVDFIQKNYSYDGTMIPLPKRFLHTDRICPSEPVAKHLDNPSVIRSRLVDFVNEYPRIQLFGAGFIAKCLYWSLQYDIEDFRGFVVSDGHADQSELFGSPVYEWQSAGTDAAIIVALDRSNSAAVHSVLGEGSNILYLF